jgi:hypothetical protein
MNMQSFKQVASRLSANQAANQASQNATQERTLIGQDSAGGATELGETS